MKKVLIGLLLISNISFAQKIEDNKTDDFTKSKIIRTSWEWLSKAGMFKGTFCHVRVSYVSGTYFLEFKTMEALPVVESISKDADVMIKLENDSVVTMNNLEFTLSCAGCGAVGLNGAYAEGLQFSTIIDKDDFDDLIKYKIKKYRIYLSDGYIEMDIDPKRSDIIAKEIKLIQSKI